MCDLAREELGRLGTVGYDRFTSVSTTSSSQRRLGITVSLPFSSRMDIDLTEKEVEEGTLVLKMKGMAVNKFLFLVFF